MITIYCHKCGCKVGEIIKGNYKKDAKGVCKDCIDESDKTKIADDLKNIGSNSLDSFKSIFGGLV